MGIKEAAPMTNSELTLATAWLEDRWGHRGGTGVLSRALGVWTCCMAGRHTLPLAVPATHCFCSPEWCPSFASELFCS